MRYFFSPIGGNDPVSSATEHDGSMLHICRHYLPDEVYLYLSKEMTERQRRDDRYRYCIEQLGKVLGHTFLVQCIEDEVQMEVQEYDYYYTAFEPVLREIEEQMQEGDVLYVNIASGTPAMKSALVLFAVMSEKKIVPIQVVTPAREINKHPGKDPDYDPEYYWGVNQDNEPGAENRCREPKLLNLIYRLKCQSLVRYIESYNYAAALMLGREVRDELPEHVYELLEYAVARMQLDLGQMRKISHSFSQEERKVLLPIWDESDKERVKIFEYALSLKVKIANKEYGDFVRAISPLLTDLFEILLKSQCNIDINPYITPKFNGVRAWDMKKMENDDVGKELLHLLQEEYGGAFRNVPVAASNLKALLMHYMQDEKLKKNVESLRKIEDRMRNLAAHEIVTITDDNVSTYLGDEVSITGIYAELQYLAQMALKLKKENWESYDKMNRMICEKLL